MFQTLKHKLCFMGMEVVGMERTFYFNTGQSIILEKPCLN